MYINCSNNELFLFKQISIAAEQLQMPCYLIGGFVRDKILGRDTKDADIVCVGDGVALAHKIATLFKPKPNVNYFKNFGTAQIKIFFPDEKKDVGSSDSEDVNDFFEVEIVGARKESYTYDSRKPTVEPGSIEDDQKRRDFTINALAISLNKENYGELVDPFNGL